MTSPSTTLVKLIYQCYECHGTFVDAGNLREHLINSEGKISGKQKKKFSSHHYFRLEHCKTFEQTTKKHKRVSINCTSNSGKRMLISLVFFYITSNYGNSSKATFLKRFSFGTSTSPCALFGVVLLLHLILDIHPIVRYIINDILVRQQTTSMAIHTNKYANNSNNGSK